MMRFLLNFFHGLRRSERGLCSITLIAFLFTGCGKIIGTGSSTAASGPTGMMITSFQLPVPDDSYSRFSGQASAFTPGTNVTNLLGFINAMGQSLQEGQLHLAQTINSGAQTGLQFQLTAPNLSTQLVGTPNTTTNQVSWTYTLNQTQSFTGTTSTDGLTGNFNVSGVSPAVSLSWGFTITGGQNTKMLTVQRTGVGSLIFNIANNSSGVQTVTLTNSFANGQPLSGKWTSNGGCYQTGGNGGTQSCWDKTLANLNCAQATVTCQ